jgi:hypothetical protein
LFLFYFISDSVLIRYKSESSFKCFVSGLCSELLFNGFVLKIENNRVLGKTKTLKLVIKYVISHYSFQHVVRVFAADNMATLFDTHRLPGPSSL